ncbi:MAG: VRR-NUC domain-containing protein [Spirochaetales bacterium]|nr:VRR-NUC domain-containing protein [Spirochaetales bacterium]
MRERDIERQFRDMVKAYGGLALKLVCPGFDGMPDRLILMPEGRVSFAEIKRPGAVPRPLQEARHRMLRNLGFQVFVIDSLEKAKEVTDAIQTT